MRNLIAVVAAVLVVGCSGGASPAPSTTLPGVTLLPTATEAAPTPAATPAATPTGPPATPQGTTPAPTPAVFASPVYPYTLELPPGVLTRNWKPAAFAWDGEARIYTESRSVDITGTVNGGLLIFGLPWDADVPSFAQLVRDNAARFNGCTEVDEPRQFEVDGVSGIGQRQACRDTQALYLVLVRDGFGLGFRMRDYLEPETVLDELVTWLSDGLTWRTP